MVFDGFCMDLLVFSVPGFRSMFINYRLLLVVQGDYHPAVVDLPLFLIFSR